MDITISLPDELGRQLLARASKQGLDVAAFMAQVAKREASKPAVAENLSPVNGTLRPNWQEKSEKFRQAMAWIKANRAAYGGQWVCLDGDRLISHGHKAKNVYAEADAKGMASPFVEYIEKENLPFGGW